ncbi:hypothetical protein llap_5849 [Limosa lapponica baueri]|uniref:Uncharacterized protein n=1 Tax=Limosa lapponica baueri TaxID=1758121 RepID=A0A2I0UCY1_LIMLA|nr:hypothetical protein llap_5849 [Limosa lapponica baueri]
MEDEEQVAWEGMLWKHNMSCSVEQSRKAQKKTGNSVGRYNPNSGQCVWLRPNPGEDTRFIDYDEIMNKTWKKKRAGSGHDINI